MHRSATVLGMIALALGTVRADDVEVSKLPPAATRKVDFARDVLPILAKSCHGCHGAAKRKGGLRLDSLAAAKQGGDSGPALESGDGAKSLLLHRVAGLGDGPAMPPGKNARLTSEQVGLLRAWIDQGATWPATAIQTTAAQAHWAFRPVRPTVPPKVKHAAWARSPIDRFILARLEVEGIAPSPDAEPLTLLRRLHLDLIGLPPSVEELDDFLVAYRAKPQAALEAVVDRLLTSPHFGERWAGHWLDLARYADSDGYENDRPRADAYRWRDWVIKAINDDLPFDQFTIQQIAGDLLPRATPEQHSATGFHCNVLHNSASGADKEEFRTKATKDMIDTVGVVWMGLTVGCAQCHTHKYDPITQREYYQLYAFFNNADQTTLPSSKAQCLKAQPRPTRIHIRGDFLKPGDVVQPATPAFLPRLKSSTPAVASVGAPATAPTRLDLAYWLVDPAHPLTARVAVNHVWQHLFGRGLVATPENFGVKGEPPSHPELLDWLAAEFVAVKWSRKELIRRIVLSATYRQASRYRAELTERDPANVLLARQNRFVVDAEIVRDLALAASGLLKRAVGGPSMQPQLPSGLAKQGDLMSEHFMQESKGDVRYRRGLYVHRQRTFPYPMLLAFDCPDANTSCVQRDRSTTPIQALTLLNDPVFLECSQQLACRVLREPGGSPSQRLRHLVRLSLGRAPDAGETVTLTRLLEARLALYRKSGPPAELIGKANVPADASAADVAAWMSVARTLMNTEEFITRE